MEEVFKLLDGKAVSVHGKVVTLTRCDNGFITKDKVFIAEWDIVAVIFRVNSCPELLFNDTSH